MMLSSHALLVTFVVLVADCVLVAIFIIFAAEFAHRLRRREVRLTDRARIIALVEQTNLGIVWAGRVVVFRCGKRAWRVVIPDQEIEMTYGRAEDAVDRFLAEVDGCARDDGVIIDNKAAIDATTAAD
jgi:hypothetical protein